MHEKSDQDTGEGKALSRATKQKELEESSTGGSSGGKVPWVGGLHGLGDRRAGRAQAPAAQIVSMGEAVGRRTQAAS